MAISLFALHGFLGLPSDWEEFKHLKQETQLHSVPLFDPAFYTKGKGLKGWAASFNAHVIGLKNPFRRVLLGYSLGARLAMHALLDAEKIWTAAILIAGNLGLQTESEKASRRVADQKWAEEFKTKGWENLLLKWNAQPAFKGISPRLKRRETEFSREQLVDALMTWSLGNQANLKIPMQSLDLPILWIVGEEDTPYVQIAQSLRLTHPQSAIAVVPGAAHRVPWEKPHLFESHVVNFLKKL
ncbi:alpha/beta fold hydrolase [Parachlamydia sp. AcF125]|uniref:alpha/beta fold hydrolase n=1 Tax=Parachlamydia sp. AcF125 TaxID=2795736 RepID=UPI001BCA4A8F|nr:alpha/beta fold hydrolase [Parachlamydia sp. AcF125]MBS4168895.1 2-succinyl-6-hydroxy-2, 4-cyclohexadiene-1-carboxylate synthase [Parachlamydia sp. AcF125]